MVCALGGLGLFGFRMWLKHQPGSAELTDDVRRQIDEAVREQIGAALEGRDREIEDMHERLDFTERMLSRERLPRLTNDTQTPSDTPH